MRRGTTPEHTFTLPFDTSIISAARILYEQDNAVKITKTTEQCNFDGRVIAVKLTQAETLALMCNSTVKIQVRILTTDGEAMASDIITAFVDECLDNEVLK